MLRMFGTAALAAILATSAMTVGGARSAHAECRVLDAGFTPAADLQIVVWLEDTAGNYVDTLFLTRATGQWGLGNRPGRFDFNSGPLWPYGRRVTTFPIWAHRHGLRFPMVRFQNGDDTNLSHPINHSSIDTTYCRPMKDSDPGWDVGTCATESSFTDKGTLDDDLVSLYPPRVDFAHNANTDSFSAQTYPSINPFDEVTGATPIGGMPATVSWAMPDDLPPGDYVVFVEVSKEFDHNDTYSEAAYPSPVGIPWNEYGRAYRGQPSVLYRTNIAIGASATEGLALEYVGYGDPNGDDGEVRLPDATITTDVPGSGASRLALTVDGAATYRVRVTASPESDTVAPGAVAGGAATAIDHANVIVSFPAPGDDGALGTVTGYDIRVRAGDPITADNFETSTAVAFVGTPEAPGLEQTIEIDGLLPQTAYSIGVRAFDNCRNAGPLVVYPVTTLERLVGEVDACFIATAAYGSTMANDVAALRGFRDGVMRKSVLGELAVETYYTFGPAFAELVGESELLRASAREALRPMIEAVRPLAPKPTAARY